MRALALLAVAVTVALAVFEVTMQPSGAERSQLLWLFVAMAAATAGLGWVLGRLAGRFRSLRSAVLLMAVASVGAAGLATAIAARMMFIQPHDLQLLTIVLGFGVALGIVLSTTMAGSLVGDLRQIRRTAEQVAEGDLAARTGVTRPDELGATAGVVDEMAARLEAAEAERARNEAARRHFLAAVGHDLRSPLSALRAAVEALEDGLSPDPQRYLRAMRADLDAMSHLVDDLFLLATIEAGKLEFVREPVDLAELADESIEALQPVAAGKGVELRLDAHGAVATEGGAAELGRVIRNLLHNAIRHTPPASSVVVRVSNGDSAEVVVEDAGPGFNPGMLERVFDDFVTDDPARSRLVGGAGLGLAIAKGIVAAHGGHIWAEPGPGGRVAFRLPGHVPQPAPQPV